MLTLLQLLLSPEKKFTTTFSRHLISCVESKNAEEKKKAVRNRYQILSIKSCPVKCLTYPWHVDDDVVYFHHQNCAKTEGQRLRPLSPLGWGEVTLEKRKQRLRF